MSQRSRKRLCVTVNLLLNKLAQFFRLTGNIVLVGLFLTMLLVAAVQVVARELGVGFYWGDDLVRMSVLWVTMVGAVVAIGDSKHIRIDLIDRLLPPHVLVFLRPVALLATAVVCALFGYFALDMIGWDYADGTPGVGQVPAWLFETVIPASAFLMALRFTIQAFSKPIT